MIFVTVGTHEQPFDRLIECIDNLKKEGNIKEEVIIQTGFSTYEPKYCEWKNLLPYKQMVENVSKARMVPRQKKYNEHVNDHQVEFVEQVAKRMENILVVEEIADMKRKILEYDKLVNRMKKRQNSNNERFNANFAQIVSEIIKGD